MLVNKLPKRLITMPEILHRLSISRTKFLNLVKEGEFPPAIKDSGGHSKHWLDSDPEEYIDKLVAAQRPSV
jgi:predicted DNA-binding transcriptional regulator AlpA